METAEHAEIANLAFVIDGQGLLRRSETPDGIDPEIAEDIIDTGSDLYIHIAA